MGAGETPEKIPSFAKFLMDQGLINKQQLQAGLKVADKFDYRIASSFVSAGVLDLAKATRLLSMHIGVEGVVLEETSFPLSCLACIPQDVALSRLVLPLKQESRSLTVAMASPKDILLIDELSFMTGFRIIPLLALEQSLKDSIPFAYAAKDQGKDLFRGKSCSATEEQIRLVSQQTENLEKAAAEINTALPPESEMIQPIYVETVPPMPAAAAPAVDITSTQPILETPAAVKELIKNAPSLASTPPAKAAEEILNIPAGPVAPETSPAPPMAAGSAPTATVTTPPPAAKPAAPAATAAATREPTILIVDSDTRIQTTLTEHLCQHYQVKIATDGNRAIEHLKNNLPDLIILDGMLPGVHGFELCKNLKSSDRYKGIPIVVTSAKYSGWEIRRDVMEQYGANEFVEKPFNLTQLTSLIKRLLETHNQTNQGASNEAPVEENNRVLLLLKEGKLEEALQLCQQVLRKDPFNAEFHYLKGTLLERMDKDFEAIEELEKAAELQAGHFNALRKLAGLYQKKNLTHKAIDTWVRAASAAPTPEMKAKIKEHLLKHL